MIKYLTTQGNNYYLENLLKNANSRIILISPYIQLQEKLKRILKEKKQNGVDICIACRKQDLKEPLSDYSANVVDVPTLHAKCYMNEQEAIITSLNLYLFSQQNNEEMGVYIKNEGQEKSIYSDILADANRLCNINIPQPISELLVGKKYTLAELDTIFDFVYKPPSGIKESKKYVDIVLFNNTMGPFKNSILEGIIYYQSQKPQDQLIFGNKVLYNAFECKDIPIHLFTDFIYIGKCAFAKKPFQDNSKWIFPLIYPKAS